MSSYVGLVLQAILVYCLTEFKGLIIFFFQFKNSSVEGNSLSTSGLDEPVAVVDRESGRKVSI